MDAASIGANTAKSIEQMGDLLKTITNAKFGIEEKIMKAGVTEKVTAPGMGENLDITI
ncbi:MAG TPA: hypothetical protein PK293_03665 [Spirochaetota bacterium]|nr:hypothetical protein [Spirochaetota bacterium]HPF05112.1 hypothetical protein [Spirochaetota bacterium]HPJ44409.1 hypothetical protein [Spirochaetota bacterium]HPR39204.1 hypothetical protein [Spirochaetota bacterium]